MKKVLSILLIMMPYAISAMEYTSKIKGASMRVIPKDLQGKRVDLYDRGGMELLLRIGKGKKNSFVLDKSNFDDTICKGCKDGNLRDFFTGRKIIIDRDENGNFLLSIPVLKSVRSTPLCTKQETSTK
jgi:hypothetical protein